jgi:hypothetical protein
MGAYLRYDHLPDYPRPAMDADAAAIVNCQFDPPTY